jgi:hypothetical protein
MLHFQSRKSGNLMHSSAISPPPLFDLTSINFDVTSSATPMTSSIINPAELPYQPNSMVVPLQCLDDTIHIRESYHPRRDRTPKLISLDQMLSESPNSDRSEADIPTWHQPWAPFPSRADFELAECFTVQHMSDDSINGFLLALGPSSGQEASDKDYSPGYQRPFVWHSGKSLITMKNARMYHDYMKKARSHILKVVFIPLALIQHDSSDISTVEDGHRYNQLARWEQGTCRVLLA